MGIVILIFMVKQCIKDFVSLSWTDKRDHKIITAFKERALWGTPPKQKLLDQVRIACRQKHYSPKTENAYVFWIRQFILFHNKRHPNVMGQQEIEAYLTHLANRRSGCKSGTDHVS